jgi:murein tripeptide amidase MpaA
LELSGTDVKNENGEADAQSNLLDHAVVYVVPNMNPDGGVRGHHCTNAAGQNLNECWGGLNGVGSWKRKAPETEAAMKAMQSIGGPDILLDIHQDETRP